MIVADASAAVSALLNDGQARRLIAGESVHAPHLVDAEVVSVLRRQVAAGLLAPQQGRRALDVWKRLGLIRYAASPLLERVWETSGRCDVARSDVRRSRREPRLRSGYSRCAIARGERTSLRHHGRTAMSAA